MKCFKPCRLYIEFMVQYLVKTYNVKGYLHVIGSNELFRYTCMKKRTTSACQALNCHAGCGIDLSKTNCKLSVAVSERCFDSLR